MGLYSGFYSCSTNISVLFWDPNLRVIFVSPYSPPVCENFLGLFLSSTTLTLLKSAGHLFCKKFSICIADVFVLIRLRWYVLSKSTSEAVCSSRRIILGSQWFDIFYYRPCSPQWLNQSGVWWISHFSFPSPVINKYNILERCFETASIQPEGVQCRELVTDDRKAEKLNN